jgi:hypothetical protein
VVVYLCEPEFAGIRLTTILSRARVLCVSVGFLHARARGAGANVSSLSVIWDLK